MADIDGLKCNPVSLKLPEFSIIPESEIPNNHPLPAINKISSPPAIEYLCKKSEEKTVRTSIVYGLGRGDNDPIILERWISGIKAQVKASSEQSPVIIAVFVREGFTTQNLKSVAERSSIKVIDTNLQDSEKQLRALGAKECVVCIMPSLHKSLFQKLVINSHFPRLSEGANLTSFLLQTGQPHLSVLPIGNTPVAQNMGDPLEALKARAFSYKLSINMSEVKQLNEILKHMKSGDYEKAINNIVNIKEKNIPSLEFLWLEGEKNKSTQLSQLSILGLLSKKRSMGSIEKDAILSAINPSKEALVEYLNDCMDIDSKTSHHFALQELHVNRPFNHSVASALITLGKHKRIL
ncbi:hypothetical protein ACH42_01745 [Endozoicomonas sp. (ex Bugula neritina AB1)]|nr:hypothetical protein ACH42_01745 [Endozoicomonas sp. (ex Bugula neritina AB1)]